MTADGFVHVLLIDDDEDDHVMLRDMLQEIPGQKFRIDWEPLYDVGKYKLLNQEYDICFLDYRLGKNTGLDLLRQARSENVTTPMILLTGYGEQEVDIEAMRVGAADYLIKDQVNAPLLERTIRYAIHRAQSTQALLDREAQILMQDRLASVGLLASSLAHEIGTPLGVIRGRAEFLEMQYQHDLNIKKNLDVIVGQIDRVSKLIRSLLNLARGEGAASIGRINLNEVVAEVLDLMAHETRKNEIEVKNHLSNSAPVEIKAEAGPLHQVFLNLLVNSVHAIVSAKKLGRSGGHFVDISAHDGDKNFVISVIDSGCGISDKNMKNLFKPFFTTKEIGVGTGLGLATCYRIVESWGGSILVKSEEGRGTEFQIRIPKA